MGTLLSEIVQALSKLPPEIVSGIAELIQSLLNAENDHDRRVAMDKAMAAAEQALLDREFNRG